MIVKLLTERHLEFLSLNRGCTGSSESTHVKVPHCWKSHALAHIILKTARRPNLKYCVDSGLICFNLIFVTQYVTVFMFLS